MQSMDKLDLILQRLEQVDGKLQKFDERMERFEDRQQKFEERMERFEGRQQQFEERQSRFEERQSKFEERLDSLDAGQKELIQLTKTILHRQGAYGCPFGGVDAGCSQNSRSHGFLSGQSGPSGQNS